MQTPIYDFVTGYIEGGAARLHMPGHKGRGALGIEARDITEIDGADVLYSAGGIIAQSEANATKLFNTGHTFYSTEGSTHAIKSMLYLAYRTMGKAGGTVLAARNVHKAFVNAAALLDLSVRWIAARTDHICRGGITADMVHSELAAMEKDGELPFAVYVTSPDYLGGVLDIGGIAEVCNGFGVPLLVDNAHGAYLAFLEPSEHPIALGAAMCADSAHKTLPVLTGGAYLHVSRSFAERLGGVSEARFLSEARRAMSLFASTSPSYLVLQSLDLCNRYIDDGYSAKLGEMLTRVACIRSELAALGVPCEPSEPLKLVFRPDNFSCGTDSFVAALRNAGIEPEFVDGEFVVLMVSVENTDAELSRIIAAAHSIQPCADNASTANTPLFFELPHRALSIREAVFSPYETIPVLSSVGRIAAAPTVSCPPAVPIVISGEVIGAPERDTLLRYGFSTVDVVAEQNGK